MKNLLDYSLMSNKVRTIHKNKKILLMLKKTIIIKINYSRRRMRRRTVRKK
jgi:hypothetical protein